MAKKEKTKGKSFERTIAKDLSDIFDQSFVRIPNSGAYVGGKNQSRVVLLDSGQVVSKKGDIHPPDGWTRWNCECKSYKSFDFHKLFTGNNRLLETWIEQTMEVADEDDFNIIFIKVDYKGKWVVFENKHKDRFDLETYLEYKDWIFCHWDEFWGTRNNIDSVKQLSL